MIKYKSDWEMELERRKLQGITSLPNPDDIVVDFRRNTVIVHNPMDKSDLAELDFWLTRRHNHEAELQAFTEDKNNLEYAPYPDQLDRDIIYTRRILEMINTALEMRISPNCIQRRTTQLDLKTSEYL
jgi:hypothetical protein